jgi:hypothetical protein
MTNWQGTQTFQLNPASTVARSTTAPLSCPWQNDFWNPQCSTLYSPNYNYVAVNDFVDSVNFPTLRIFSISSGQLLNSGMRAAARGIVLRSPFCLHFDRQRNQPASRIHWQWCHVSVVVVGFDQGARFSLCWAHAVLKIPGIVWQVFWASNPGSNPLQTHLYMWDVTTASGTAVQITPTVTDGGGLVGVSFFAVGRSAIHAHPRCVCKSVHITQNPPMIVFQVGQATSSSTTALYAYNFEGGSNAVLRTLNPAVINPTPGFVSSGQISQIVVLPSIQVRRLVKRLPCAVVVPC